jgi:non-lysosomal glucosylceramidase
LVGEDPWNKVNAYISNNTADWKDLNLKFVLETYRDYLTCFDGAQQASDAREWFVRKLWPVCVSVMAKAKRWDKDCDGMIENDPDHPDQTYDIWIMNGPRYTYSTKMTVVPVDTLKKVNIGHFVSL